mgnify:CR=1 FL=1
MCYIQCTICETIKHLPSTVHHITSTSAASPTQLEHGIQHALFQHMRIASILFTVYCLLCLLDYQASTTHCAINYSTLSTKSSSQLELGMIHVQSSSLQFTPPVNHVLLSILALPNSHEHLEKNEHPIESTTVNDV